MAAMEFSAPLIRARLVERYKRFLADVDILDGPDEGRRLTVHCPNSGSMMGLSDPGMEIWLERAKPTAKLPYGWRLVTLPGGHLAGIDTIVPNRIVKEALAAGRIPELAGYAQIKPEQRYSTNSRIDFLLSDPDRPPAYVEVKNVHLMRQPGLAEFPDCVTARGAKHLRDLAGEVARGNRAVMLYVLQRDDCDRFALAHDLDPAYTEALSEAIARGVEALAYRARLSTERISLDQAVALDLRAIGGAR